MSVSSLIAYRVPAIASNYTKGRNTKISEITVHHMAGVLTAKSCGELFQVVGRNGSSHYGIGNDGEIANYVNESDTAWTNSHWKSNCRAVTIEVSNSEYGGKWTVSDKALTSLVKLVADIARRNGLHPLVKGKSLTWHSMYAATSCPGEYLYSKLDYIVSAANKLNEKAKSSASDDAFTLSGKNIQRLADALVLYSGSAKAPTNKYGYEVTLDKNFIATANPKYSGSTPIPTGGYVLSGHGEAGKWIIKNIKKGYLIYENDGKIYVDKRQHRALDGIDAPRTNGSLIAYTKGKKAPTNKWGYEVGIVKYKAESAPVFGKGSMEIPEGGFVLSGHSSGSADSGGKWLYDNIKKGSSVSLKGKIISVG